MEGHYFFLREELKLFGGITILGSKIDGIFTSILLPTTPFSFIKPHNSLSITSIAKQSINCSLESNCGFHLRSYIQILVCGFN